MFVLLCCSFLYNVVFSLLFVLLLFYRFVLFVFVVFVDLF